MKNTYCVCYNTLNVFKNKENAKKFFSECFYSSEGCEHERYGNILVDLMFSNIGLDRVDNVVWEISYFDIFGKHIKSEKIEHSDYMKIIEKIEKESE